MMQEWSEASTGSYQDHVIAHVVGATALGYFIIEDAAYLLLDIALIWTVYTSGEMALMPQRVVVDDLELEDDVKAELLADIELLHEGRTDSLSRITPLPEDSLVRDVKIYALGERRRVVVEGEERALVIESRPSTGEIRFL